MFEKALKGGRSYWLWVIFLIALIVSAVVAYNQQRWFGLTVTGMGRDVSWGLYNAQCSFFAAVAAASMMIVFPSYLRQPKEFAQSLIIGQFTAVSATLSTMIFLIFDFGRPDRLFNILLHHNFTSMLFWKLLLIFAFLAVTFLSGWALLGARRKGVSTASWVITARYLSFFFACSLAVITVSLYAVMPARPLWLTAAFLPRFFASALAAGGALLTLLCVILKRTTGFDAGKVATARLALWATVAGAANLFLLAIDFVTALFSKDSSAGESLRHLYFGLNGSSQLVPWMWFSLIAAVAFVAVLLVPALRRSTPWLVAASSALLLSVLVERGFGLIVGAFVPSPLGEIVLYAPTATELVIVAGGWGVGTLALTLLLKVFAAVECD